MKAGFVSSFFLASSAAFLAASSSAAFLAAASSAAFLAASSSAAFLAAASSAAFLAASSSAALSSEGTCGLVSSFVGSAFTSTTALTVLPAFPLTVTTIFPTVSATICKVPFFTSAAVFPAPVTDSMSPSMNNWIVSPT